MEITKYKPDGTSIEHLTALLRRKYGSQKNFDFFLNDFTTALDFCTDNINVSFHPFNGQAGGKMELHGALILDRRLPTHEAFFGFMEFPNDASAYELLWERVVHEAKAMGISVLKGPVNGSIWHQYRCIKESDTTPAFIAEPYSEPYYYNFFVSQHPTKEISYYSASRKSLDMVLKLVDASALENMKQKGFSIQKAANVSPRELHAVASISRTVFTSSWGYTELNEREFSQLYTPHKLGAYMSSLYLLYRGDEIIGFCSTAREDATTLICKTIAVLPQYQGIGLGNALAYKVHSDATAEGYTKIVYALIREGNSIDNFPKQDAVVFRRYAAFEFTL